MAETSSSRVVITVLGKNRPGIVAGMTCVLSEASVDIRDITQSIIEDIFTKRRFPLRVMSSASPSRCSARMSSSSCTACSLCHLVTGACLRTA